MLKEINAKNPQLITAVNKDSLTPIELNCNQFTSFSATYLQKLYLMGATNVTTTMGDGMCYALRSKKLNKYKLPFYKEMIEFLYDQGYDFNKKHTCTEVDLSSGSNSAPQEPVQWTLWDAIDDGAYVQPLSSKDLIEYLENTARPHCKGKYSSVYEGKYVKVGEPDEYYYGTLQKFKNKTNRTAKKHVFTNGDAILKNKRSPCLYELTITQR